MHAESPPRWRAHSPGGRFLALGVELHCPAAPQLTRQPSCLLWLHPQPHWLRTSLMPGPSGPRSQRCCRGLDKKHACQGERRSAF